MEQNEINGTEIFFKSGLIQKNGMGIVNLSHASS